MLWLRFRGKQIVGYLKIQSRHKSAFQKGMHYLFKENLLLTNSITSGGFMSIGDLVQQEYEYQSKLLPQRYDWARAVRMFIVGAALGPMHHYYYIYIDKVLPHVTMKNVTFKILCDQFIVSPVTLLCFFYGMGFLEGKTLERSTQEIKKKFSFVYMGDWLFWPPVQFINFYYLPTRYRVFSINFATMIYNIFLSYSKHCYQH